MKTKEISFTIPFIIALYEFVFFRGTEGRLRFVSPFFLTLLIIPLTILGPEVGMGGGGYSISEELRRLKVNEAFGLPRDVYLLTQFRVITTYIRLLFLPANQHFDYDYPLSYSLFEPGTFFSFLFLLSILALAIYVLRESYRKENHCGLLFSFGVFWFFITLSVESFLVPIKDVIFEHRIYLPSVGLIISFSSVLFYCYDFLKRRFGLKISPVVVTCVFIVFISPPLFSALYKRNQVWTDELTLMNDEVSKSPGKANVYYVRGIAYLDMGKYSEAVEDNTKAILLKPNYREAYSHRAIAYSALGRYDESIDDFNRAIEIDPTYIKAYFNRALTYAATERYEEALKDFGKAIGLWPDYAQTVIRSPFMEKALEGLKDACEKEDMEGCNNLVRIKGVMASSPQAP
jgi:hypothetical protein